MNERVFRINRILIICDFFLTCLAVCAFSAGAYYFAKWWIALFALIPLALYTSHGIIVDADLNQAEQDGESDE